MSALPALELIRDDHRAQTALHPLRRRILESLARPDSAAGVARALALPRQQVNYHLRLLEDDGLVEFVEERMAGNCVERLFRARARSFVITPDALGTLAPDPGTVQDRFSAAYLAAVASRAVQDVGELTAAGERTGKKVPTLTIETEVRFASSERQHAFARALASAVADLVARFHDDDAPDGRTFRFLVGGYPAVRQASSTTEDPDAPEAA